MRTNSVLLGAVVLAAIPVTRAAWACGGGVTTTITEGALGIDAQRAVISVRGGNTDVVAQVNVPTAADDYGILLPVFGVPTLDPNPVSSDELDALDVGSRPTLIEESESSGGGCGSGAADGGSDGVNVTDPVTIGPVTAVVLTVSSGGNLAAWLSSNGFMVPPAHQAVVDDYVTAGARFIAFKRSNGAPSGASSVGVHFTVPGDARGYPLRISAMGAAAQLAVTVWVAGPSTGSGNGGVGPASPFEGITLNDLSKSTIREQGYGAAVAAAVTARNNQAFVVEGVYDPGELVLGTALAAIIDPSHRVTRLSSIFDSTNMTADAAFTQLAPADVTDELYVDVTASWKSMLAMVLLVGVGLVRVRRLGAR